MDNRKDLEDLLALKEELLGRQADDPLYKFQPHAKQTAFIESVLHEKKDENWFVAANRAGKSEAGAYIDACLARFGQDPKSAYSSGGNIEIRDRATSGWVSSVTFPESRDILQPKIFDNEFRPPGAAAPFIPQREILDWRKSDKILLLKNGSIIGFKSAESGVSAYQGAQKDYIHFDEEHPKNIYNEASIRIGGGRRLKIFGTATLLPPENSKGGVTWVYSEILKPFMEKKRNDIGCFAASIYDNPYLLPDEIRKLESKYPPESQEGRIRLGGEWLPGLSGARAYTSFDVRIHVRPQPLPMERRPLCWALDFNVQPMLSIVGQRDRNLFRVYKVLRLEEGNIEEMCQLFADAFPQHHGEVWVYGDATGQARSGQTNRSYYQLLQNYMRSYRAPIRLKVPSENGLVTLRINAVNHALKDENGESHIEINNEGCEDLVDDLEQVLRDGRGGLKKTFDHSDPYFYRTHSSDAFGYWVNYDMPVRIVNDHVGPKVVNIRQPGYGFAKTA